MNIFASGLEEAELNTRVVRIQVRVKAIMEGLLSNTETVQTTGQIFKFLGRLVQPRRYVLPGFFTEQEKKWLSLDERGRILYGFFVHKPENRTASEKQKKMLIITFIIVRMLIGQLLTDPEAHISSQISDRAKRHPHPWHESG